MAIDGTPPFKLPPGAQPIVLNDLDIWSAAQQTGGIGPYVVPAGRRLIITAVAWSLVETNNASATPREYLLQTLLSSPGFLNQIENDGNPPNPALANHTILGIVSPGVNNASSVNLAVSDLCIPIRNPGGLQIKTAGGGTNPQTNATNVISVLHVFGYLEPVVSGT